MLIDNNNKYFSRDSRIEIFKSPDEKKTHSHPKEDKTYLKKKSKTLKSWTSVFQIEEKIVNYSKNSLFIFSNENKFRKYTQAVVSSNLYVFLNNIIIILNCIFLIFETIDNMERLNLITNNIFISIFTLEMVMKIIAYGFVLEKHTYLRDPWNWIDFIIVIIGLASFSSDININLLPLRAFRLFQALKTISLLPSMKTFLSTLFNSLFDLSSVFLLILFFYLIFAILGLSLWSDRYDYLCRKTTIPIDGILEVDPLYSNTLCGGEVTCNNNLTLCLSAKEFIDKKQYSFDPNYSVEDDVYKPDLNYGITNFNNIFYSLYVVFQTSTTKGWTDIMYLYINGHNYFISLIYFCLCVIFNYFFILNLTVAVLLFNFEKNRSIEERKIEALEQMNLKDNSKEKSNKRSKNKRSNHKYDNFNKIVSNEISSKKKYRRKYTPINEVTSITSRDTKNIRSLFHKFSKTRCFENVKRTSEYHKKFYFGYICFYIYKQPIVQYFFYSCIIANTVVLFFNRKDEMEDGFMSIEILNIFFVSVFSLENVMVLLGLGFNKFIRDFMNVWDFLVVLISLIEIILLKNMLAIKSSASSIASIFRLFRILRIFKLIRTWQSFQVTIGSIKETLIRMANYIIVFCIFIYIYTLLGCLFFKYSLRFDPITNKYSENAPSASSNFDNFISSFVSVLQVLIGDNWFQLYFDCYRSEKNNRAQTIIYFITLVLFGQITILNIFQAYLIDNFESARKHLYKNIKVKKYIDNLIYYCSKQHELEMIDYNSKTKNQSTIASMFNYYLQKLENKKLLSEGRFIISAKNELDFLVFKRKQTEMYDRKIKKIKDDRFQRIIFFDELFMNEKKKVFDPDEIDFFEFGFDYEKNIEDTYEILRKLDLKIIVELDNPQEENDKTYVDESNLNNLKENQNNIIKINKKLSIVDENPNEEIFLSPNRALNKTRSDAKEFNFNLEINKNSYLYMVDEENLPQSIKNSFQTNDNEEELENRRVLSPSYSNLDETSNKDESSIIKPVEVDYDNHFSFTLEKEQKIPSVILNVNKNMPLKNSLTFMINNRLANTTNKNYENEKPRNTKSYTNNYIYNYRGIRNFVSEKEISSHKRDFNKIKITSDNQEVDFKIKNNKTIFLDKNNQIFEEFIKTSLNQNDVIKDDENSKSDEDSDLNFGMDGNLSIEKENNHSVKNEVNNKYKSDKNVNDPNKSSFSEGKINSKNTIKFLEKTKTMELLNHSGSRKSVSQPMKNKDSNIDKDKQNDNSFVVNIWNNFISFISESSLCIFHYKWTIRMKITDLVENKFFGYFITFVILSNCVTICLDSPWLNPDDLYAKILKNLNNIFSIIFIIEGILKIIAYGFLFGSSINIEIKGSLKTSSFLQNAEKIILKSKNTLDGNKFKNLSDDEKLKNIKKSIKSLNKKAYIRDVSNIIDLFVILISILDFIGLNSIRYLNTMRALRSLRPIRIITKNKNLKLIITCLLKSIPAMANVLLVCLVFILIYAILGVSLFKVDLNYYCTIPNFYTQENCLLNGGLWIYNYENFSNILYAFKTLFELMMSQGWIYIMNAASQGMKSKWVYLYFITFVIAGYLFILNLFVSIVVHKFKILKNKENNFSQLTEEEREWVKVQKVMLKYRPMPKLKIDEKNNFMKFLSEFILSKKFENVVLTIIILSFLSLVMHYNGDGDTYDLVIDILNYFFVFLFNVEIILKIIVYKKIFFKNAWNIFDFIVILICDVSIVLNIVSYFIKLDLKNLSALPITLRSLRFLRVIRLLTAYSKLRALIDTLVYLFPTIVNIGMIMTILIVIYGCIGMNLFGTMPYRENIHTNNNFRNFLSSALLLFRITTGEKWNFIMNELSYHNCTWTNPDSNTDYYCLKYNYTCYSEQDLNYTSLMEGAYSCGSDFSFFYFISFMILGPIFIMNLCVVMVIEGFAESMYENSGLLSQEYMDNFVSVWMNYDPDCNKVVRPHEFVLILKEMFPPFGFNYDRYLISDPTKLWSQRKKLVLFKKILDTMQTNKLNSEFEQYDPNRNEVKYKKLSNSYEFKNFYLSKNKKFNTTDLEVLKIMDKFRFEAVEQPGLFKKNYSYTFTNVLKKDTYPSTIIEYDKGIYIHFVDACLGLSRFVVSKNNNIAFDKFREQVVGTFTKKMWSDAFNPNEIDLYFHEKKKNKVSEKLGLRIISKVKMLFVKKLHKIRERIASRNMKEHPSENQTIREEEKLEENENNLEGLNVDFLPKRFDSKPFDDCEEKKIFSLNIDEEEVPMGHKMRSENSSVNSSQLGSHRARSVSFNKNNKPVKNNNNLFYDLEEIRELNEVESDSQLDDIKDEIEAFIKNKNSS